MATTDTDLRTTTARLRHVRTSPPKVRLVLELIRGQDVETARDTLTFCDRAAAREVGKLLDSAVANAEHNNHIPEDELFVARAHADEGPTLKRWRPRARGRGVRIRKRTSHVTIILARFAETDLARRRQVEATSRRPRRTVRRRPAAPTEAELEVPAADVELEEAEADVEAEPGAATVAQAKRAPAAKTTAKKPAKSTAKKTAKKSTKKTTAKKAAKPTAKKAESAKKTTPRTRRPSKPKDED